MAAPYPGPMQVGSYFVGQHYQVLQQHPDLAHQFYSDASSMIRIDGDSTDSASAMLEIHTLATSLNFSAIEIKTINSLGSWNGGVLVMVSGSVRTKESSRRKFVQTFFLAPQEKGYFVLNDIFQFTEDEPVYHHPGPVLSSENQYDAQLSASSPLPEQSASDYVLEEDARDYVNSVHIEDDPVDEYNIPEEQEQEEPEPEVGVDETPSEETPASFQTDVNIMQAPSVSAVEEPVGESQKKTYASILLVAKNQYPPSVTTRPSFSKSASTTSDWNPSPQSTASLLPNYPSSFVPESGVSSYVPESGFAADGSLSLDEGEVKSVYVRNLPSTVDAAEIEQEFKNFGRIKPDGVFVRNRKDVGVCYAFVEFEDISSVQNAIQASPIHLAGRQVYIEERRPNSSSSASRGGRRGRGRGSYQTEAPRGRFGGRGLGRGSSQDSGDYNRLRGNGFYQRGSQ